MSILADTAPKRIFLCISDEPDDYDKPYPELYAEDAEITWSTDTPVAVTVEYVREDLSEIAKLRAERDALLEQRRNLLDNDLKASVCVALQKELNAALAKRDALAALLRDDNIIALQGRSGVLVSLLTECWRVIGTIDGDDDEENEQLRALCARVSTAINTIVIAEALAGKDAT